MDRLASGRVVLHALTMGFLRTMKETLSNAYGSQSPEVVEERLRHLTPEQRARYDATMAQVQQARVDSQESWTGASQLADLNVILGGPAGRHLYGHQLADTQSPESLQQLAMEKGVWAVLKQQRARGDFTSALKQTLNIPEVPQEADADRRADIARQERAARDSARAPYNAPQLPHVEISRLATRGGTQLAELISHLETAGIAAHPDKVYGVYRVPDRISPMLNPSSERGRVVEWDIVHAPMPAGETLAAPSLTATSFVAEGQLVRRALGEPSVLDEDVALAFLRRAGLGPESCLGVARFLQLQSPGRRVGTGTSEDEPVWAVPQGVIAFHREAPRGSYEQMMDEAPVEVDDPATFGVHVEVINWAEVAKVVHPRIFHPPSVPSPFPYLPSTPQELLRAHLEIVGLRPEDAYSAQVTVQRAAAVRQEGMLTSNLGPKQPCADGKDRTRSHAAQVIVVAYRDRPEYAEGRGRWVSYQQDVLQAHLDRGTGAHEVLQEVEMERGLFKAIRKVDEALMFLEMIDEAKMAPYRYCWPPTNRTP